MKVSCLNQFRLLRITASCLLFGLLPALSMIPANAVSAGMEDAFAQCRELGRGVNVLGYDPIWESFQQARFKKEYFGIIREGGFDSLRVNLFPFSHMGPGPDYRLGDSWWSTMDWIVTNALATHLNVIVDLHESEAMSKNAEGNHGRFLAFWRQVSARFQKAPSSVYFEVLNEPNGEMTSDRWNQYLSEALAAIREKNPTRAVIVGPAFWNAIDVNHLDELKLPNQDRHIIVTAHYYTPMNFTHQGAPWVTPEFKLGVAWNGTPEERDRILSDFQILQNWAKQHGRPVFLGEFGAYDKGDMASRARYTACVARSAEHFGWSWAYWQFDRDFIVYNIARNQWVAPIHNALISTSRPVAMKSN